MNDQKSQQKIKIRQFQWFEVQTRVREIMSDILQPFSKKQTQDMIRMNEMKRNIASINKKLQNHDFLLDKQNVEKPTYLQLQDDKIIAIEKINEQHITSVDYRLRKMQGTIEIYQKKIIQIHELQQRIDKDSKQKNEQFRKYKTYLDEQIQIMFHKQDQQQDEINIMRTNMRNNNNKLQNKINIIENLNKEMESQIRRKNKETIKMFEDIMKNNQKIEKIQITINDLTIRLEDRQKDTKLSEKFYSKVKEIEDEIYFLINFLDKYQPLYIQIQISDTLNCFIEKKNRQKVCLYEQRKFAEMHQNILTNEKNNLRNLMSLATNKIKKIINRNKKYIINMQVENTVKYGSNTYQFRIEDLIVQNNNNTNMNENQQNNKIINTNISIQQIQQILKIKIQNLKKQFSTLIEQQLNSIKTWLQQIQDQSSLSGIDFFKKINQYILKSQKCSNTQELQQKTINKFYKDLQCYSMKMEILNGDLKQFMTEILNFNSVLNHIIIQDEIDRQSTALYAIGHTKGQINDPIQPTLQLNQQCLSCQQKNTSLIQQAFKMACLAYNPSQIRIDNQLYSREQILQISTNILETLKGKIQSKQNPLMIKLPKTQRQPKSNFQQKSQKMMNKTLIFSNRSSSIKNKSREDKLSQYQTLLPVVTKAIRNRKSQQKQRTTHQNLSIFY